MKTKKTLSCYTFSNLLVGIFCFNFLITDSSLEVVRASNDEFGTLRKIYEVKKEVPQESVSVTNNVYTVSVSKKEVSSQNIQYIKPSYNSVTGKNIVNYAKHYLGLKYVHAGNSLTTGTDCSGFTKLIYQEFGISLGRTVSSQTYSGQYVRKSDLQPGDLVFYGYTNYATHVGIYMGDGLVIHQSNPRDGVKINSVNMMVYITARRVIFADIVSDIEVPNETEVLEDNKEVVEDTKEETSNKEEDEFNNSKENADSLNEKNDNDDNDDNDDKESQGGEEQKEEILDSSAEENIENQVDKDVVTDKEVSENVEVSNQDKELIKENGTLTSSEVVEEKIAATEIGAVENLEKDDFQEKSEKNN